MTDEMPTRIQALWGGWEPDDRKWLTKFRKVMRARYANAVTRIVLLGSKARGDWNDDSEHRHTGHRPGRRRGPEGGNPTRGQQAVGQVESTRVGHSPDRRGMGGARSRRNPVVQRP